MSAPWPSARGGHVGYSFIQVVDSSNLEAPRPSITLKVWFLAG